MEMGKRFILGIIEDISLGNIIERLSGSKDLFRGNQIDPRLVARTTRGL